MGGGRHAPAALPPGKTAGTHSGGDWVGPIVGRDGCGKSHSHRDWISGPVKIKNCLKVTSKHKTKNITDIVSNFMNLKFLSFMLSLFLAFSVRSLSNCHCRCTRQSLHLITLSDTHSVDSSGRRIGPSQGPLPEDTQHSQDTDIHFVSWIRTRHPSKRAAADSRLLATWDTEHKMQCQY